MKRFLSILLAVAMIATMSVAAFAETFSDISAEAEKVLPVTAAYENNEDETEGAKEIVVDVEWADLEFTYEVSAMIWDEDADVLDWVDNDGEWSGAGTVDITNRSSVAITTSVTYAAVEGIDVEAIVSNGAEELLSGKTGNTAEWTITVDDANSDYVLAEDAAGMTVGNVTVAIAEA